MNIAIIPARGGSKRIPGKNIKMFAGKPLIAYSIEAAKESGLFDKILISTDSEEVAEVAKSYGADVPFIRPQELSNDFVGTRPVTNHGIKYCIEHFYKPEFCCCIYATAPFLQAKYLQQGLDLLKQDSEKSFAFSVTSFPFPVQRALKIDQAGISAMFPEDIGKRSQDLQEAYHDAGQFYWGRSDNYLSNKKIFSQHSLAVVLPRHLVQDIDTPEDWLQAELMYQAYVQRLKSE
ncbi:pseudaminic acid cytidylyltransferase [Paraglaciecola arctica]|uniref:N-acylneuraminate cytidylyltransferase n=1 Tax=Paraglaciecola arctica BSs20135 TaxID=493475 RepID=K6YVU7_9ALTE|nr:pseudaminic acid cytidylyltransferase [Paraglaciecola arctica]GAC20838.1 N-acylneuraminate cytidylyltransferase [Paraglaciecola arctica BSs20135]